uniref:Transmembrane protein adipocyte-associated 1 homolog n=1 Tax=Plectus sambesii TaxID=2011161 RepID=A0A914WV83_9BILA
MSFLSPDNPSTSFGEPRLPYFLRNTSDVPVPSNSTHDIIKNFCKQVLVQKIGQYSVRVWDVAILVPNLIFLIFLIYKFGRVRQKLRQTRSPVFKAFFLLVYITTILNIVRCVVSMCISATNNVGETVDRILWLVLKFFLLSAELCVLTFGLLFGHLDSRTSIRRVLAATIFISLLHSSVQTLLEFKWYDTKFVVHDPEEFDLYAHGGMAFWMVTSGFFVLIYVVVCALPLFPCIRNRITLPQKPEFYGYCLGLAVLNAAQVIGAGLIFANAMDGMCVVDVTSYAYFALYTPVVYFVFLRRSLSSNQGGPLFSYHQQKDETGVGELPDSGSYYPRFPGLTSPSYDDLFDYERSATDFAYDQTDLNSPTGPNGFFAADSSMAYGNGPSSGHPNSGVLVFNNNADHSRNALAWRYGGDYERNNLA